MSGKETRTGLAPGSSRLFTDAQMETAWCAEVAGGVAALYSRGCPATADGGEDATDANQDGAALYAVDAGSAVLAVADGLGGQPGGGRASRITLEALGDTLAETGASKESVQASILKGIEVANRSVLELGIGAGTTVAVAEILVGTMRPYHVGDSEILVVGQRGRIKLQTVPHSPVGYAVESGLLDRDEAMKHDDRHYVSNLVGSADMRIEMALPISLAPRDTLLLATDGLFDNLPVPEIADLVRTGPIPRAAEKLAAACSARMREPEPGKPSKPDDLTFILYRRK